MNVVFTCSGAVDLRTALSQTNRQDVVIAFSDNFALGPINPSDWFTRQTWIDRELDYDVCYFDKDEVSWSAVLSNGTASTIWFSSSLSDLTAASVAR